jgi:hypothetical protein
MYLSPAGRIATEVVTTSSTLKGGSELEVEHSASRVPIQFFSLLYCTVVLYLAVLRVSAQDLEYYVLQCCWRYSRNSYSYSSPASLSLFRCRVLFTHLAMVQGLQGNNIHFSAAATLCQQIVPHFASQLHGTNLESLAFALATTISC